MKGMSRMKELKFTFNKELFEWPPSEGTGDRIDTMEGELNEFLYGVETIEAGGVLIHLDWLHEQFKAGFDTKYIDWFSLKVVHAAGDLPSREALSVIIRAGDTLRLKKNDNGDIASIELIKAVEE